MDTTKSRELAGAAAEGPYRLLRGNERFVVDGEGQVAECDSEETAAHFAHHDPPMIQAMCDEIDQLRGAGRKAGKAIALLKSMVDGGEYHTAQSLAIVDKALEALSGEDA